MIDTTQVSIHRYARTLGFIGRTSYKLISRRRDPNQDKSWLRDDLTRMGPVYIKLGQIISSRTDVFSSDVTNALSKMQDRVGYMDFEQVNYVFKSNFDKDIRDVFDQFAKTPIASASIGQVHRARIKNIELAVKVMKPNIKEDFVTELAILINLFRILQYVTKNRNFDDVLMTLNELYSNVKYETDFLQEMQNMMKFRDMLSDNKNFVIPRVHCKLCSKHILTMEYVPSTKITTATVGSQSTLAKDLMNAFVTLLTNENYLHCDPHPGNIGIDKMGRIVLYDYGMVKKFNIDIRMYFKEILFAILNRSTDELITFMLEKKILIAMESNGLSFNDLSPYEYAFIARFLNYVYRYLGELDPNKLAEDLMQDPLIDLNDFPFEFDSEMVYLIKTFSTLEGVCKQIDPSFNYLDMIEDIASDFVSMDFVFEKIVFDLKSMSSMNEQKNDVNAQMRVERLNKSIQDQQTKHSIASTVLLLANMILLFTVNHL
jgi:predicted unusual protein kinase regulating ubiquinone biosynthesis (AarF/ABC1/UbiB family)